MTGEKHLCKKWHFTSRYSSFSTLWGTLTPSAIWTNNFWIKCKLACNFQHRIYEKRSVDNNMANAVTKSSVCSIVTSSIFISNLIFGAKTLSKSGSPHPTQYTWLAYVLVEKQQDFLSIDTLSSVMTIIPCWHAKPNLKNHRVQTFFLKKTICANPVTYCKPGS